MERGTTKGTDFRTWTSQARFIIQLNLHKRLTNTHFVYSSSLAELPQLRLNYSRSLYRGSKNFHVSSLSSPVNLFPLWPSPSFKP